MRRALLTIALVGALLGVAPSVGLAQEPANIGATESTDGATDNDAAPTANGPGIQLSIDTGSANGDLAPVLKIALLLLFLSLIPAILVSVTSFTRIVIVLGFLRQSVGAQGLPPNQVLIGLALFLSLFTMAPVFEQIKAEAWDPYQAGEMTTAEAVDAAEGPLRAFLIAHTHESDLELFLSLSHTTRPERMEDVSTVVLVPSFMLSELKTAFTMGAMLFIPFIIIDLLVASLLMSMGMMMVPPAMVSLPVKILLFVLADGWNLVVGSLARSVMGG